MSNDINRQYYSTDDMGRIDYWEKMAAPRFRSKTILKILSTRKFDSVVDLGCGSGLLLQEISKRFKATRFHGIDLSEHQIKKNKESLPQFAWTLFDLDKDVK